MITRSELFLLRVIFMLAFGFRFWYYGLSSQEEIKVMKHNISLTQNKEHVFKNDHTEETNEILAEIVLDWPVFNFTTFDGYVMVTSRVGGYIIGWLVK